MIYNNTKAKTKETREERQQHAFGALAGQDQFYFVVVYVSSYGVYTGFF